MLEVFAAAGYGEETGAYFDTPSCGLPPAGAVEALIATAQQWGSGEHFTTWEQEADGCRTEFALQRGIDASRIGLIPSVTSAVAGAAGALARRPGWVVAHRQEFRSLLLPFLAAFGEDRIRWVSGDYTADSFIPVMDDDVVAVIASSVASHNGARLDICQLADEADTSGIALIVDSTQSEGIVGLGVPYARCRLVVTAGYKGLLGPRGTGYAVALGAAQLHYPAASPYGMEDNARQGSYGPPLQPYPGGRGLEQSPAWQCWGAARSSLSLLSAAGEQIEPHVLSLAGTLREELQNIGAVPQRTDLASPVVSVPITALGEIQQALDKAGIRAAVRADRLRLGTHGYTSAEDIDRLMDVLSTNRRAFAKEGQ